MTYKKYDVRKDTDSTEETSYTPGNAISDYIKWIVIGFIVLMLLPAWPLLIIFVITGGFSAMGSRKWF